MPDFQYIAREKSGKTVKGTLSGSDQQEVLQTLSARQLFPVEIKLSQDKSPLAKLGGEKVPIGQQAQFYGSLSDLLSSGVPLLRALSLLEEQTSHKRLKSVLQDIREQVADGNRLAEAMRRHPKVFPEFALSLVEAGEEGSFIEDALQRLGTFTEHQNELRSKVVGSMTYPIFVFFFGILIVIVMLVYFVPQFQPIFDRMEAGAGLHWTTITLMSISDFLKAYWPIALLIVAGLMWGFQQFRNSAYGKSVIDRLLIYEIKLGNKPLGPGIIFRRLAIARFARVLGTLLGNGVPMLRSLQIARNASGNSVLSDAIGTATEQVSGGKSLAIPLRKSGQFPAEVVEVIAVGEESNRLDQVLVDVAERMERRTQRQLEIIVRLLEPIMLLALAGIILFMMFALLLPILQSSNLV